MSSKIGSILSLLFVVIAFLFSMDIITVQFTYSNLDAISVNVTYLVSRSPLLNNDFYDYVSERYKVTMLCDKDGVTTFGEEITYVLTKTIKPLILSNRFMTVSIERYAMVGYYG